jgi:hypothetical protein
MDKKTFFSIAFFTVAFQNNPCAVAGYNMAGRTWLHFEDAVYLSRRVGDSTELTRITTWKSELKPRLYWDLWEKMAVEAGHEYVLSDLRRRLDAAGKSGRPIR